MRRSGVSVFPSAIRNVTCNNITNVTTSVMIAQGMVVKHQKQNLYVVRLCYRIFLTSLASLQSRQMRKI